MMILFGLNVLWAGVCACVVLFLLFFGFVVVCWFTKVVCLGVVDDFVCGLLANLLLAWVWVLLIA